MTKVNTNIKSLIYCIIFIGIFVIKQQMFLLAPDEEYLWTPDVIAFVFIKSGIIYLIVFLSLHFLFRFKGIFQRFAYVLASSIATCAVSFAYFDETSRNLVMENGLLSAAIGIPFALGGLIGILYHVNAGYSADGDDPHSLQNALDDHSILDKKTSLTQNRNETNSVKVSDQYVSGDNSHIDTGDAEYFNGPLQVRTSVSSMLFSAIASTGLYGIGKFLILFLRDFDSRVAIDNSRSSLDMLIHGYQTSMAPMEISMGLMLFLPFALVIAVCHYIAKWRNIIGYGGYAVIGLVSPVVFGLFFFFAGGIIGAAISMPTAIAMLMYRKLAGLEPKVVHEDIAVSDRRNLVGAHHARRNYGRVINN